LYACSPTEELGSINNVKESKLWDPKSPLTYEILAAGGVMGDTGGTNIRSKYGKEETNHSQSAQMSLVSFVEP